MNVTEHAKSLALEAIQDYIWENLFEPNVHWPMYEFKRRSYARWAASEIKERIKNGNRLPVLEVYDFFKTVDDFSKMDSDVDMAFIFKTAAETAEEIGSLLV